MTPFTKMQGLGNDFIIFDLLAPSIDAVEARNYSDLAKELCDRKFGVGADGLILVEHGQNSAYRMRVFNADGSESEMCGNGLRCFARYVSDRHEHGEISLTIETGAGPLKVDRLEFDNFRVDMGRARLLIGEIGMAGSKEEEFRDLPVGEGFCGTAISMGNPHLVIFVDEVDQIDLRFLGPKLECSPLFPNRTNVHFVQVQDRTHLRQRTWERGSGVTMACGTGACASAVAAFLTGRSERQVEVQLPGGTMQIEYLKNGNVLMTGPAEMVYDGELP